MLFCIQSTIYITINKKLIKLQDVSYDTEEEKVKEYDGNDETRPFMVESTTDDEHDDNDTDHSALETNSFYSDISSLISHRKRGESDDEMFNKTKMFNDKYSTTPHPTLYEHTSIPPI